MNLEWSAFAHDDRNGIFDYIELHDPRAAATIDSRISAQVNALRQFPESGRPGRVDGTRELVIDRTPYIVAYRILGDTVCVLRVLHGSQQWPDAIPDV